MKANYFFTYSDDNYREAINCTHTRYYNSPMTITVNGKKFIVPCGTSDRKTVKVRKHLVYIVSENSGLDYIGMTVIDLNEDRLQECYLSSNDLNDPDCISYNLLKKGINAQIRVLSEYLN